MKRKISPSEEDYLKAIYHKTTADAPVVSTTLLAEEMGAKPSSVTDMVQRLSEKSLVIYQKYKGVKLSDTGNTKALSIIRKHRLWEVFLVNKLHFSWDQVHDIAEQLEHIQSEALTDRLASFLGHPKTDPHGDPIPTKEGNIQSQKKTLLNQAPLHTPCVCVGVEDSSAPFLQFLDKFNIGLGAAIEVKEKEVFDGSLLVSIAGKEQRISKQIAQNLYINTF
ncbi:metal-dependent transcriptional regulator [bacterium]|jgi:DtxR family transcriptional regulator, Mn-dependent transcriptional regulator|nr:metal-dependent transcriptional regulator [bacterium]MDB9850521.1 metal-dependent transcriptional regulator [Flavobacteriaceae bacterium]MDB9903082.1 metal-dependent transcriptional regulator [Flavobacteriaceae bacterium]MDO7619150.1 metal-dependent transcriptional regulator [Flavobacteriaceae bacterium]MDO7627787.1 metal-dependent transcriptional regulator [Flavobacteriaceae bacterium]|tara:strand:+ start:136 stop:801 length:666 start_codon:yes stop_codon:yes gene_type:complete